MKPINITDETKMMLFKDFAEKFMKELDNFSFNKNETKFSFSCNLGKEAKEKITILYSQKAYIRMLTLVDFYDTEVGWYGFVEKLSDHLYYVYDVKLCKQYVNGTKVDTEDEDTLKFFDSLTDEEAAHMHFQAHSHVRMGTMASGIDLQNQADVIRNMGKTGFYIFQIWNKSNDINTYLYDLDNNMFYDKKDIIIDIEDDEGTISDFVDSTVDLVVEKKSYPYQQYAGMNNSKKNEKEEKEKTTYLNGYWDGNSYAERWDW